MVGASLDPMNLGCPTCATFDAVGRRGMSDGVDLGVRVYSLGAALEGRFQIYASPPEDTLGVSALVSLAPGVGGGPVCDFDACRYGVVPFAQLGVVVGVRAARFLEFVVAPRAFGELRLPKASLSAGGSFAVLIHLPRGWSLEPEVSCFAPVAPIPFFLPRIHFGIGVLKAF